MFYTCAIGKSSIPFIANEPTQQYWDYVSLDLWVPWFLATVETISDDISLAGTIFLRDEKQLEALTGHESRHLSRVQLVLPCEGKRLGWHLEEVVTICRVSVTDTVEYSAVELANGVVFSTANRSGNEFSDTAIQQRIVVWKSQLESE